MVKDASPSSLGRVCFDSFLSAKLDLNRNESGKLLNKTPTNRDATFKIVPMGSMIFTANSSLRALLVAASVAEIAISFATGATAPIDLTDQFDLPAGFHIYRAAGPELTGGSYAATFDGEGRLLV